MAVSVVSPKMGYTTVQKLLQIMLKKGLVRCIVDIKPMVYEAAYTEEQTQQDLLLRLVNKAFGGSPSKAALQLVASRKTSTKDLADIERLIQKHKKG